MSIYALADLHLSISCPEKDMAIFGPAWHHYQERLECAWRETVSPEDLVLLPGDISWAMKMEQALIDLKWLDALPGTKLMIRGNHDYWWGTASKMRALLPTSLHAMHQHAYRWGEVVIAGARLWDTDEFSYYDGLARSDVRPAPPPPDPEEEKAIWRRELGRLETCLKTMPPRASQRIVMTHYPPVGPDLAPSSASALLEAYQVDLCVFGHLHNVTNPALIQLGTARGVTYRFVAGDALAFRPLLLSDASADRLEPTVTS